MWTYCDVENSVEAFLGAPSLAELDGNPAAVFVDNVSKPLYFSRCGAPDRSGEWTTQVVDRGMFQWASMAVVNGYPAICACKLPTLDLVCYENEALDGSGNWISERVDISGAVGWYCSLSEVAGKPAVG